MPNTAEIEDSELWKEYRTEQQERRANRLPVRTKQILSLRDKGYQVEKKTPYQYRINNTLDIFPIHNLYHDIRLNKRGGFQNVVKFVKDYFGEDVCPNSTQQ
jgi:hypothetical protein